MNIKHARPRRSPRTRTPDPIGYAARRLTALLLVPAAMIGVIGIVLAEAAGLGHESAIVAGLGLFLGATVVQTLIVAPRPVRGHRTQSTAVTSVSTWNK